MAENSPEELNETNEDELNSINPLNEEDTPVDESGEPVEDPAEAEPEPESQPEDEPEGEPVEEEGDSEPGDELENEPDPEPEPEPETGDEPEPETRDEPVEEEGEAGDTDEPIGVEETESGIEQTKIRRNKKMKYGLKEVADVIFFDIATNRPVLVFDTSK